MSTEYEVTRFEPDADPTRYRYVALADHFTELINSGILKPNTKLPPELQLGPMHGVSLGTARRTVWLLRERGLVITVRAKGTYVTGRVADVHGDVRRLDADPDQRS